MAASPHRPPESRAPPPSPVAAPPEDDELDEFLARSLRVPELVLPDRIFPLEATAMDPPMIDVASTGFAADVVKLAAAKMGCFQIVNHGISDDVIDSVEAVASALFRLSPAKKKAAARSPERRWGFEAEEEEEEEEGGSESKELFWWRGRREEELAGIWPTGHKDFSNKLQILWVKMEKIASKIGQIFLEGICDDNAKSMIGMEGESALCLQKHSLNNTCNSGQEGPPRLDMLRTLIRSSGSWNALNLHLCRGPSAFHVYSKRGWMTFGPADGALVVTIGDQIQEWSGGLYKCVTGKPFYNGNSDRPISISFLYSYPASTVSSTSCTTVGREKTISFSQQVVIAIWLTLLCHVIVYIYSKA